MSKSSKKAERKSAASKKKAERKAAPPRRASRRRAAAAGAAGGGGGWSPAEMKALEQELAAAWKELGVKVHKIEELLEKTFKTDLYKHRMAEAMKENKEAIMEVASAPAPAGESKAQARARKRREAAEIRHSNEQKLAAFIATVPASAKHAAKLLRGREVEIKKKANELHIHLPSSKKGGRKKWVMSHLHSK